MEAKGQVDTLWAAMTEMRHLSRDAVNGGRAEMRVRQAAVDREVESFRVRLQKNVDVGMRTVLD